MTFLITILYCCYIALYIFYQHIFQQTTIYGTVNAKIPVKIIKNHKKNKI